MSAPKKATTEQIIAAYRESGTVWGAAKLVGMSGQAVWERLRAINHPMHARKWSAAEITELRALAGTCSLGEIARRLGRPYTGVATKISALGLGNLRRGKVRWKAPRVAGYDKRAVQQHLHALEGYDGSVSQFCRAKALHIDPFVKAVQRHFPEWWAAYVSEHSVLGVTKCPNCGRDFHPMTKKQKTCSRKCSADARADRQYFGGKRSSTIGLAEGICQVCSRHITKGLTPHHVYGKENDPGNTTLVALCPGCHQTVGQLAKHVYIEGAEGWENLISLVLARHYADQKDCAYAGVHVFVDIENLSLEELTGEPEEPESGP